MQTQGLPKTQWRIDPDILRYAGRDICRVDFPNGTSQGFYLSTGRNSGMEATWLPFNGILPKGYGKPWFNKIDFCQNPKGDPLHRFGTPELKEISEILPKFKIPKGKEATIKEINSFLDDGKEGPVWQSQQSWESFLFFQDPKSAAPTNRLLECEEIALYLHQESPSEPAEGFFRTPKGKWEPFQAMGIRPDGGPLPLQTKDPTPKQQEIAESLSQLPLKNWEICIPERVNHALSLNQTPRNPASMMEELRKDIQKELEVGHNNAIIPTSKETPIPEGERLIQKIPGNAKGRDFVCGDMHGHPKALESLLKRVNFNPNTDRVFCTGDLVDRGPNNLAALNLLNKPWFHPVRGNHDHTLCEVLKSVLENPSKEKLAKAASLLHKENGQEWIIPAIQNRESLEKLKEALPKLKTLPLGLLVGEGKQAFLVSHAGPSNGGNLPGTLTTAQIEAVANGKATLAQPHALIEERRIASHDTSQPISWSAQNLPKCICGHNPMTDPFQGTFIHLDTGAGHKSPDAKLSLIEPATMKLWQEKTQVPEMAKKKPTPEFELEPV